MDKSTAALFESMEYDQDAQRIESGEFYRYVYDLFGVYGGMNKAEFTALKVMEV